MKYITRIALCLFVVHLAFVTVTPVVSTVYAQEEDAMMEEHMENDPDAMMMEEEGSADAGTSEYPLPYPGILPDHPLYFLKRLRDRVLDALITDPIRKSEFYLLQGDKRLQMGLFLVERGKTELAATTVLEGERFMEQAVTMLASVSDQGEEQVRGLADTMKAATGKHVEVLESMLASVQQKDGALSQALEIARDVQAQVVSL